MFRIKMKNILNHKHKRLIGSLIVLLLVPGCNTDEDVFREILLIDTLFVYLMSLGSAWLLSRKAIKARIIIPGIIIFVILSFVGPFLIRNENIEFGFFIFGPVIALLLVSPIVVFCTAFIYFLFKLLKLDIYFVIPYIVTLFYFISLLLDHYYDYKIVYFWLLALHF